MTLEFGTGIDRALSRRVTAAARAIAAAEIPGLHDIVPTFRSLTLHFDPDVIRRTDLLHRIGALTMGDDDTEDAGRLWHVPVLYGGWAGPDLAEVAQQADLREEEAAARHAAVEYHVYMLGFLPGFAYLGDLPPELRLPRLATPRTQVPAGSIAIAEAMTAVYPSASPGGWRLIGRTPLRLFDPARTPPALLAPGDRVRFEPITAARFDRLSLAGGWPEPVA